LSGHFKVSSDELVIECIVYFANQNSVLKAKGKELDWAIMASRALLFLRVGSKENSKKTHKYNAHFGKSGGSGQKIREPTRIDMRVFI
jgi:hypothetical protein